MSKIEKQLKEIIGHVFDISPVEIEMDFSHETCSEWDSINHITLIMAIEESFGISFEENEILNLNSYEKLLKALGKKV